MRASERQTIKLKLNCAFAVLLMCSAVFGTALQAQPAAPDPAAPSKPSGPAPASPYRLSPGIQSGTVYAPVSEGTVYVDPEGDDANDGQTEAKPVRSLAAAYSRLGSRRAMLLKRGGIYSGPLPRWTYSNKLLGAYGSGAKPVVKSGGKPVLTKFGPASPSNVTLRDIVFDNEGLSGVLLFWIGPGENVLIENCEFLSGGLSIQTASPRGKSPAAELRNWRIIGNKIAGAWDVAGRAHKSGLFASGIDGLEILGNTFDHNGWNPAKPGGQATMFNHNLYLTHVSNVVVKDNSIERASSIGIKFRSDSTGGSWNIVVEGNRFLEGEVGISLGGNSSEPARFRNVRIVGNVFDRLGATQPTGRRFAWGMDIADITDAVIKDNLFTNMPDFRNRFLVQVTGSRERVVVENNAIKP